MRFTIGSLALTKANAFNPTTRVFITAYHPNVFDARGESVPLQIQRIDGQTFNVAASLKDGALVVHQHRKVWIKRDGVIVLPDLCEEPEHIPQPPVDIWEQMNGQAARNRLEKITTTEAAYFMGVTS